MNHVAFNILMATGTKPLLYIKHIYTFVDDFLIVYAQYTV